MNRHDMFQQISLKGKFLAAVCAQMLLFFLDLLLLRDLDGLPGDPLQLLDVLDVHLDLDFFDLLLDFIRAQHFDRIDQSQVRSQSKAIKQGSFIFITFGTRRRRRPRFLVLALNLVVTSL